MAWTFSKRCKQALDSGKIKVTIPRPVRNRIWKALQDFNQTYLETPTNAASYYREILDDLTEQLKAELGIEELIAYPETPESPAGPSDLKGFVLRGNIPRLLMDALEIFFSLLSDADAYNFQKTVNEIMEESNLGWRMADGKIFPVQSAYIEEEITRRAYNLLHQVSFEGALVEFEKARTDLANGDESGAIQNANLAVESTIKGILEVGKAKPGKLFRSLIELEIVPEYYDGFLNAFEENILRSVAIIRNEELGAGHGQGATQNVIPKSLAELAVNLSAVLIYFLIERHLESKEKEQASQESEDYPW